ncbi:MAG: penicillin-binding transpeptidase domain-containing protein [Methylovirgula sp.]
MASLPDFDPNNPVDALRPENINRMTVGVYEMGSTFKAMTLAMALDARKVTLNSQVDARESLRYGRFTIHDFEPQHRFFIGAGVLHLFVEYLSGAHCHDGWCRWASGLSTQDGAVDAFADRTA